MIYAVIELHEYDTCKSTHTGHQRSYETTKEYQLKFSGDTDECTDMMWNFKKFCTTHECKWGWNYEEDKMCEDSYLGEEFHCYCQLMSSFLASQGFIPAFSSSILHYYYKN